MSLDIPDVLEVYLRVQWVSVLVSTIGRQVLTLFFWRRWPAHDTVFISRTQLFVLFGCSGGCHCLLATYRFAKMGSNSTAAKLSIFMNLFIIT